MNQNKTKITSVSCQSYINMVEPPARREDAFVLLDLFTQVTGWQARMWGESIIGFGQYHYRYKSGREGDYLATGFSPRKARLSIYIMPGYADYASILARLGKHSLGVSCLYVNKLSDIDIGVLAELIGAGLADLGNIYPVRAT